jgi:LuxR family transcriptional regulator, maltose regulon positive regulatory protein
VTSSLPSRLVERPRLVDLVERGIERPLTLISAPAGSGKTVLLTSWMATCPARGRVATLTLGREHTQPRQFWIEVLAAAEPVCGELAGVAVPPRGELDAFVTAARASLAGLDEPLVLVLDDLHEVGADSGAIAELWWLLEHASDSLRLVVATRRDPPLRLQRLKIAGQMTEIRAADLAFTLQEAGELVAQLDLAPDDVELLWRRTEGWAAGLRLAELSLHDDADAHAFIAGFAGEDRAVSDYLMSEVIARYPPETLDFLLRTCVAARVNGELADALTGEVGGEQALRELERMDGFVVAGGAGDGWYRYHPLFAEALRAELRRRLPRELPSLHRAAGRWHSERGTPLEAVRHAVAARDWELAAEVIGEHWLGFVVRGSGAVLLDLAAQIPEEAVYADAELALAMAGLLLEAGELHEADDWLVRAYDLAPSLPSTRRRRFAVTSTATSLYRARLQGDVVEALSAARVALDERWDRSVAVEVRALTLANLGIAEFWSGDSEEAADHLQVAAGLALECGNDYALFIAESYLAAVDARAGRPSEAFSRARTAIQLAERRRWTGVAHAAIAYATLATVHLWWNEFDDAEHFGDCARQALGGTPEPLLAPMVAQIRARLLGLRGDPVTALEVLRGAGPVEPLPPWLRVSMGMIEADLWFALGEPARARKTLAGITSEDMSDSAVGVARLELAMGDPTAALGAVATFLADEHDAAVPSARTEAWVIDAVARNAIHDEPGALRALERALDLAEPRGYSNVFLRYGGPARSLMRRRIAAGTAHRAFAGELLAAFDEEPASGRATAGPLLERLSDRELALLRFLPTMMSNAEIAGEMFVSVNTVKTHLKHVYRKLDVSDRRGAVRRGRELRLLGRGLGER